MDNETSFPRFGATVTGQGVDYACWAPDHTAVAVNIISVQRTNREIELKPSGEGFFTGTDNAGQTGDLYTFRIDQDTKVPDFASRFQPTGPFGASQVIDPSAYVWQTSDWFRPPYAGQVIYELHLGTFSAPGTFLGALAHLPHLVELGVTAVQIMPIAEWAGQRNWGYDGVFLFAPTHTYGTPDEFRALIDACHGHGLAVILDVVWNHLGPVGNVSPRYTPHYFHAESRLWGNNFNLDAAHSASVRAYLKQNIIYWLEEFRIDGFRMDATHAVRDESTPHLLAETAEIVHRAEGFIIAEDDRNDVQIFRSLREGGWGFDGAWADDFHHSMRVSQTNQKEAHFRAYTGTPAEIAETLEHGWLYRGQVFPLTDTPRGTESIDFAPERFITCLSNHDQVGNRAYGERLHHDLTPAAYRALSLFFCLTPYTPMLFMGQDWAASTPFLYFTDLPGELGAKVGEHRRAEFEAHLETKEKDWVESIPDPQAEETFQKSKLKWDEVVEPVHQGVFKLYQSALDLRRQLFGKNNPPRSAWQVEAGVDFVAIQYYFGARKFTVRLDFAKPPDAVESTARRTLLSSNQAEFIALPEPSSLIQTLIFEHQL